MSIAEVLERHGLDPRRGRTFCPNPTHNDRHPGSVVILPPGRAGKERIYCHSCGFSEDEIGLRRLFGEHVSFSRRSGRLSIVPLKTAISSKLNKRKARLTNLVKRDETFAFDWAVASQLARLNHRDVVTKELLRNWDWLSAEGDIRRICVFVGLIWDYGVHHYGLPPEGQWRYWVGRVA